MNAFPSTACRPLAARLSPRNGLVPSLLFVLLTLQPLPALSGEFDAQVRVFVDEVVERHGLPAAEVESLLADARRLPEVLAAISRPAEAMPWHRYRPIFLTKARIDDGVAFWREHADLLDRAEARFGVEPEYIVAIIGVETFYGRRKGTLPVLDSLATLAFAYPPRADFFRRELEHFVLLTREEQLDARGLTGSYAGAMGIPQFISSSYRAYAVDFNEDGVRDLLESVDDAVGSVANYLALHGWVPGGIAARPARPVDNAAGPLLELGNKPHMRVDEMRAAGIAFDENVAADVDAALIMLEGDAGTEYWAVFQNFYSITRYNRSNLYAMAVVQLAREIREGRARAGG